MINLFKTSPLNAKRTLLGCLVLLTLCAANFLAIGQTGLKYIPSTAQVVVTVNLPNLDKKVNLDQMKQYDFFEATIKEMYKSPGLDEDTLLQQYFEKMIADPASLGYDANEPFYIVVEKVGFDSYTTFIQKMSDRARYEKAVQQLKGNDFVPYLTEVGEKKIWQHGNDLFAWNNEVVLNIVHEKGYDPSQFDYGYDENIGYDSIDWSDYEYTDSTYEDVVIEENIEEIETLPSMDENIALDSASFIFSDGDTLNFFENDGNFDWIEQGPDTAAYTWALKLLNKDFLHPITQNQRFNLAKGRTNDVHFWMDYSLFTESITKMQTGGLGGGMAATNSYAQAMAAMGGFMNVFYKDTYVSMGLNFENGRMAIRSQLFSNEDMKRFYSKALDAKFNKKFLRYVKGGDEMFGYFYVNYNVKNTIEETKTLLYKTFAATPQYGQLASDAMKILGIFIDEEAIGNLLKGDLMVSVSGMQTVEVKTKTFDYDADFNFTERDTTIMQNMPIFTALASYGNGADIQKFIDLGIHSNVLVKERNFYKVAVPGMEGQNFFLAKHDGLLIFTNNQYLMQQNLATGFEKKLRLPKNHKKRLCKNGSVVYWNIPNTIKAAAGSQADSNIGLTGWMNNLGKEFYSVEMTTSKKVGDAVESEMFLNMTNKDMNALQQFFNFVNDVYLEMMGGAKI
ncbi:MAG: DUF4836 family protein [Saprospiraceae bacterium]|nr:DUF4836 family protein [Saprospiraceae bacterium]